MKTAVLIAAALAVLAVCGWWAARFWSRGGVSGRGEPPALAAPESSRIGRQARPAGGRAASRPAGGAGERLRAGPASATAEEPKPRAEMARPQGAGGRPRPRYEAEAAAKLETLQEILGSKNDNDPRLDRDFNDLSPEVKRLLRQKYRRIPPERRNDRGTIVYLLGRNLKSAEDWTFLREVVSEPPCLSLADCSKEMKTEDDHRALGAEVTLAYPSLVALKQAQRVLEEARTAAGQAPGASTAAAREALLVIRAAKNSKTPIVAKTAAEIGRR